MKCPCKTCTDRTPTCHGTCVEYKEWRKLWDERREKIQQQKQASLTWTKGSER